MTGQENSELNRSELNKGYLTIEQRAEWLVAQAALVRHAEERALAAQIEVKGAQQELARFTAKHSSPEVWSELSPEQADEIIDCFPDGEGYFGLDVDEGIELATVWLERTGIDPADISIR